jgi:hypothetical protein
MICGALDAVSGSVGPQFPERRLGSISPSKNVPDAEQITAHYCMFVPWENRAEGAEQAHIEFCNRFPDWGTGYFNGPGVV